MMTRSAVSGMRHRRMTGMPGAPLSFRIIALRVGLPAGWQAE